MSSSSRDAQPPRETPEASVILQEEQLRVAAERVPTERIRVRKVIVTEQRTITVEVSREEIQLIREPLEDGADAASSNATPIVLIRHEERVDVTKTVVPVERVTIDVRAVSGDREVTAALARETVIITTKDATDRAEADAAHS